MSDQAAAISGEAAAVPTRLLVARRYLGTHEAPGAANNPTILGWASRVGDAWVKKYYTADSIPWCGLFAGFCCEEAGEPTPGDALLGALNWAHWGQPLAHGVLGAVLVFARPGGGHVGFYEGEDATHYHVLGGNQSDSVCIVRVEKARCVARRWAPGALPTGGPLLLAANGVPISTNEA